VLAVLSIQSPATASEIAAVLQRGRPTVSGALAKLERSGKVRRKSAEEAFVASSVYEVMAVSRIEEHELPTGGPVTQATARKMRAHVESELAAR
jgi:Mn-dependent DtxR family transcriptional regulator